MAPFTHDNVLVHMQQWLPVTRRLCSFNVLVCFSQRPVTELVRCCLPDSPHSDSPLSAPVPLVLLFVLP